MKSAFLQNLQTMCWKWEAQLILDLESGKSACVFE